MGCKEQGCSTFFLRLLSLTLCTVKAFKEGSILDMAVDFEIVNKSGAWSHLCGERLGQVEKQLNLSLQPTRPHGRDWSQSSSRLWPCIWWRLSWYPALQRKILLNNVRDFLDNWASKKKQAVLGQAKPKAKIILESELEEQRNSCSSNSSSSSFE